MKASLTNILVVQKYSLHQDTCLSRILLPPGFSLHQILIDRTACMAACLGLLVQLIISGCLSRTACLLKFFSSCSLESILLQIFLCGCSSQAVCLWQFLLGFSPAAVLVGLFFCGFCGFSTDAFVSSDNKFLLSRCPSAVSFLPPVNCSSPVHCSSPVGY